MSTLERIRRRVHKKLEDGVEVASDPESGTEQGVFLFGLSSIVLTILTRFLSARYVIVALLLNS